MNEMVGRELCKVEFVNIDCQIYHEFSTSYLKFKREKE